MSIRKKISLHWDSDSLVEERSQGEGIYADLDVYDDELEEEEHITEECKGDIGFAKDWDEAISLAKELAKQYNAEFNEEECMY